MLGVFDGDPSIPTCWGKGYGYAHVVPGLQEHSMRALEARLLGSPRVDEQ
jgi:hypothetical protein